MIEACRLPSNNQQSAFRVPTRGGLDVLLSLGSFTRPSSRRTRSSIVLVIAGLSFRNCFDVLAALAEPLAAVGEPRAALLDDLACSTARSSRSPSREMPSPYMTSNSASRNGGATLFFTTLTRVRPPTTDVAVLDRADAADVDADRRVELQRAAAGRRFRVAEHDADLLAQLVDEDEARLRLRDDAGELAQRLRHEARLQAHLRFAHLAFDFGARHERRDRVDDDDVDAVRSG